MPCSLSLTAPKRFIIISLSLFIRRLTRYSSSTRDYLQPRLVTKQVTTDLWTHTSQHKQFWTRVVPVGCEPGRVAPGATPELRNSQWNWRSKSIWIVCQGEQSRDTNYVSDLKIWARGHSSETPGTIPLGRLWLEIQESCMGTVATMRKSNCIRKYNYRRTGTNPFTIKGLGNTRKQSWLHFSTSSSPELLSPSSRWDASSKQNGCRSAQ